VFSVAWSNPWLRFVWWLQSGKPVIMADESKRLGIEFMGGLGNAFSGCSLFAFPGGVEGIIEGIEGGIFELEPVIIVSALLFPIDDIDMLKGEIENVHCALVACASMR